MKISLENNTEDSILPGIISKTHLQGYKSVKKIIRKTHPSRDNIKDPPPEILIPLRPESSGMINTLNLNFFIGKVDSLKCVSHIIIGVNETDHTLSIRCEKKKFDIIFKIFSIILNEI